MKYINACTLFTIQNYLFQIKNVYYAQKPHYEEFDKRVQTLAPSTGGINYVKKLIHLQGHNIFGNDLNRAGEAFMRPIGMLMDEIILLHFYD